MTAPDSISAQVTWDTDDASDARVDYGPSPSGLSQTAFVSSFSTSHSVTVSGLTPETTYFYQATSCNVDGVCGSSAVGSVTTDVPGPVTIEAESLALSTYQVDSGNTQWIMVPASSASGTATGSFPGPGGVYDVEIYAIAEDDGQPAVDLRVGGVLVSSLAYPLGSVSRDPVTLVVNGVSLAFGDEIQLVGYLDTSGSGMAHARLDKIVFIPTGGAASNPTSGNYTTGTVTRRDMWTTS